MKNFTIKYFFLSNFYNSLSLFLSLSISTIILSLSSLVSSMLLLLLLLLFLRSAVVRHFKEEKKIRNNIYAFLIAYETCSLQPSRILCKIRKKDLETKLADLTLYLCGVYMYIPYTLLLYLFLLIFFYSFTSNLDTHTRTNEITRLAVEIL